MVEFYGIKCIGKFWKYFLNNEVNGDINSYFFAQTWLFIKEVHYSSKESLRLFSKFIDITFWWNYQFSYLF